MVFTIFSSSSHPGSPAQRPGFGGETVRRGPRGTARAPVGGPSGAPAPGPGLPGAHSFGASFLLPGACTCTSSRLLAAPRILPPPATSGSRRLRARRPRPRLGSPLPVPVQCRRPASHPVPGTPPRSPAQPSGHWRGSCFYCPQHLVFHLGDQTCARVDLLIPSV